MPTGYAKTPVYLWLLGLLLLPFPLTGAEKEPPSDAGAKGQAPDAEQIRKLAEQAKLDPSLDEARRNQSQTLYTQALEQTEPFVV